MFPIRKQIVIKKVKDLLSILIPTAFKLDMNIIGKKHLTEDSYTYHFFVIFLFFELKKVLDISCI